MLASPTALPGKAGRWLIQQPFMTVAGLTLVLALVAADWNLWTAEWTWLGYSDEADVSATLKAGCWPE